MAFIRTNLGVYYKCNAFLERHQELKKGNWYVRITLDQGSTYTQPLDDIAPLIEEIKEAAANDSAHKWLVEMVKMTPEEYAALPEFDGH